MSLSNISGLNKSKWLNSNILTILTNWWKDLVKMINSFDHNYHNQLTTIYPIVYKG